MRIYLQTIANEDTSPRYYQMLILEDLLEGWTLVREWGYQGSSGRVRREHFDDRELAEEALLRVRDEQLQRGYQVVFMQAQSD